MRRSILDMYVQLFHMSITVNRCVGLTLCHSVSKLMLKGVGHLASSKHSGLLTFLNSNGPWSSKARHRVKQQLTLSLAH